MISKSAAELRPRHRAKNESEQSEYIEYLSVCPSVSPAGFLVGA